MKLFLKPDSQRQRSCEIPNDKVFTGETLQNLQQSSEELVGAGHSGHSVPGSSGHSAPGSSGHSGHGSPRRARCTAAALPRPHAKPAEERR